MVEEPKCIVCDSTYKRPIIADNWETHSLYQVQLIHTCSNECKRKLMECINLFEEYNENKKINRNDSKR